MRGRQESRYTLLNMIGMIGKKDVPEENTKLMNLFCVLNLKQT